MIMDAIWSAIPPWVWPLVSLLLMPLLYYGHKRLRLRHLETELKKMDGLRLTLAVCRKETAGLEQTNAALVAQHSAELPQLIRQYRAAQPDEVAQCLSRLSEWLTEWSKRLGDHAAHSAMAQLTAPDREENQPDREENQGLPLALLAAALGNRNAADLLIESEVMTLAQSECSGAMPFGLLSDQAWERLFAVIRPSRQSDLMQQVFTANQQGVKAYELADYPLAGRWLRFALYLAETLHGPDHPDVTTSLNNLAVLYWTQGQYALAEPLCKRALAIREKALGPCHSDTAISLNSLAVLHNSKGNYAQAEPLFKRSLAIFEQTQGPDHLNIAKSLNNLAELYQSQGQYAWAEPLLKRSREIREKILAPGHPDVAISLNNLAQLYRVQGQHAQAEPLCKRSLAIWEQALGPDHPNVARSLEHIAALYRNTNREKEAEALEERAVAIRAIQR